MRRNPRSRHLLRGLVVAAVVTGWITLTGSAGYAAGGTNLLRNGTFDGTGSGDTSAWSLTNATLGLASDGVGGGYAGRLAASAAGNFKMTATPKPVKNSPPAGELYRATGWIRSDAPGKQVCLQVDEQNASGTVVTHAQCVTSSTAWTAFPPLDVSIQTAGDSLSLNVRESKGVVGDSFEVDDLSIVNTDTTAPTAPGNLTATAPLSHEVDLAWDASSDTDVGGVTGYAVYRNGGSTPVATLGGSATSWQDTTVTASTSYTYTVVASDFAGNTSTSNPASVTTPSSSGTTTYDVWHLDELSGTTMADATGNHPGVLHDVALGQPGDPAFPGTAYGFNGTSSYVTVPNTDDLNAYNDDVHIAFSLRTTTVPPTPDYDLFRKGQYPGQEYKVELQPNGQLSCDFRGTLLNFTLQAGPDLHDGLWHRVACDKTQDSVSLTIDGVTWTKAKTIGSISNDFDIVIGAYPSGDYYQGDLDEVVFKTS
ncbi:MAG TPA: LamG domain-containing protein [Marmoricola sp.]|nr:LamG domain-containing protein [Marmoricola sp.]